jgi:hypothetical protein
MPVGSRLALRVGAAFGWAVGSALLVVASLSRVENLSLADVTRAVKVRIRPAKHREAKKLFKTNLRIFFLHSAVLIATTART